MRSIFVKSAKNKPKRNKFKVVFTFQGLCNRIKPNCKTDVTDLSAIRIARTWLLTKVHGNFIFAESCYYNDKGSLVLVLGPYDTMDEAKLVCSGIHGSMFNGGIVETDIQVA